MIDFRHMVKVCERVEHKTVRAVLQRWHSMTCKDSLRLASLAIDGALPAKPRALFDEHLRLCPNCRRYYSALEAQASACASLSDIEPPPAFSQSWQKALSGQKAPKRRPAQAWGSAVAATLVVGLAVMMFHQAMRPNTAKMPSTQAQMMDAAVPMTGGLDSGGNVLVDEDVPAQEAAPEYTVVTEAPQAAALAEPEAPAQGTGEAGTQETAKSAAPAPKAAKSSLRDGAAAPHDDFKYTSLITLQAVDIASAQQWLRKYLSDNQIKVSSGDDALIASLSKAQYDALVKAWADSGGIWQGQFLEDQATQIRIVAIKIP